MKFRRSGTLKCYVFITSLGHAGKLQSMVIYTDVDNIMFVIFLLAPVQGLFFKPKYRANILYLF